MVVPIHYAIKSTVKAAQKVFFSGPATKRGGGGRGSPLRKKTVFKALKKIKEIFLWPLSSRGGGKAFAASLTNVCSTFSYHLCSDRNHLVFHQG